MAVNKEKQYFEDVGMRTTAFYPQQLFSNWWVVKNHMNLIDLSGDKREFLKEKLGKQDFVYQDSERRNLYSWRIELKDGSMWILTGKGKGTCYEYLLKENGSEKRLKKQIKKYLTNLFL